MLYASMFQAMFGHDVTRVVYTTAYDTSAKVLGFAMRSETESTTELWVTDDIGDFGLDVWLRSDPPKTGMDDLDRMIAASMPPVEGIPLRSAAVEAAKVRGLE